MNDSAADRKRWDIAVGLLCREDGRVLIGQRRPDTDYEGWWEFPGGKFEPGESAEQALQRELHEELGIEVVRSTPVITLDWSYPGRDVRLHTRRITSWRGDPVPMEGQAIRWAPSDSLHESGLLPANKPIVDALCLPECYLITPDPVSFHSAGEFVAGLRASLIGKTGLVRLRAPSMTDSAYAQLAAEILPICHERGAVLLLDRSAEMVEQLGADGLHLTRRAMSLLHRRPLPMAYRVAASCHDPRELDYAQNINVDFCVLSPVRSSPGHPGRLGWRQFARWVLPVKVPVYALGGMRETDIEQARRHGGQGIAAVRGLWANGPGG